MRPAASAPCSAIGEEALRNQRRCGRRISFPWRQAASAGLPAPPCRQCRCCRRHTRRRRKSAEWLPILSRAHRLTGETTRGQFCPWLCSTGPGRASPHCARGTSPAKATRHHGEHVCSNSPVFGASFAAQRPARAARTSCSSISTIAPLRVRLPTRSKPSSRNSCRQRERYN